MKGPHLIKQELKKLPLIFRIITALCLLCNFFMLDFFDIDQNNNILKILRILGTIGFFLFVGGYLYITRNKKQ